MNEPSSRGRIRGQPVRRSPSSVLSPAQVGLASDARSTTRPWGEVGRTTTRTRTKGMVTP